MGEIGAGDDGFHALHGLGFRGVDVFDAGMGMGAAQDRAPKHAWYGHVGAKTGATRDLVDTIRTQGARADNLELAGLEFVFGHQAAPLMSAAVASTARMILS